MPVSQYRDCPRQIQSRTMNIVFNVVSSNQLFIIPHPSLLQNLQFPSVHSHKDDIPEPDTLTEEKDDDEGSDGGVDNTAETSQKLYPEQLEASTMKETIVDGVVLQVVLLAEQARGHHAPETSHAMDCTCTHGIVNTEPNM